MTHTENMDISGSRIETRIEIEIEITCLVPEIKLTCVEGVIGTVLCQYLIVDVLIFEVLC